MAIEDYMESDAEQEAGIRAHGEWITTHPEVVCRLLAVGLGLIGAPLARSDVTKQVTAEVQEMCLQLAVCFASLGHALWREQEDPSLDFDALYAKTKRPNPLVN